MKVFCPRCKTKLEVDVGVKESVPCPTCAEMLDVSALRAATCPFCGCGFEKDDEIRICPDCKNPHHAKCWSENQGCSIYGCASAAHQETHTVDSMPSGQNDESGRISITLDEVNSAQVDAEIYRQGIVARMVAHQEQTEVNTSSGQRIGGGFFRKAVVYMAMFGLAASTIGWGVGEIFFSKYESLVRNSYNGQDLESILSQLILWYITIGLAIGLGLAIAEPVVGHNRKSASIRGIIGAGLGVLGGFICMFFTENIYHFLGGGSEEIPFFQQVFARGVAWSILGAFLAIAPGITMRSWKKFLLGLVGGAIGGLIGGMLFDPICQLTGSDVPARCVNILGLGVGAAVATALLEEVTKQGWLKVATGVITGKQFILYRNPTVIGSSPKTEIYLFKDPTVAPRHAAINSIGGEFLLSAINGATVLLNGRPVRQQRLRNGDQIRVGNTIFLFGSRAKKKNQG